MGFLSSCWDIVTRSRMGAFGGASSPSLPDAPTWPTQLASAAEPSQIRDVGEEASSNGHASSSPGDVICCRYLPSSLQAALP